MLILFVAEHCFFFRYASGFKIPEDIPFEDLSRGDIEMTHTPQQPTHKSATLNLSKKKSRIGILGIFGSNKVKNEKHIWCIKCHGPRFTYIPGMGGGKW